MATLTAEMKDMVANQQCFIGTVSQEGLANVAPKRTTRVFDDGTLIFTEGTGGATWRNIQANPRVVVAVVDREIPDGYRFIGHATIEKEGAAYEGAAEISKKMGRPAPIAVVKVHVEEIHSLKPGPGAGKPIA
ncbi:MAG TPA: pyridoxamine 5'-phosphate oxidase family protein [Anaerolineae bacterium]|jgi:predicted pyridoxine 5'-phosphate oxidase superfamily flavin-nucleotide-binding protein|nr:pyridoxamine 5'-phosphate oxidase family protein [Anaerolineae bacterium]